MYPLSIIVLSVIAITLYVLFLIVGSFKIRSPFITMIWVICFVILAILFVLNLQYAQPDPEDLVVDYDSIVMHIHFDLEDSIPNMYSSVLLFVITGLSALLFIVRVASQRLNLESFCWFLICLLFAVSTIDESISPENIHGQDLVLLGYVISGVVSGLSLIYIWWQNRGQPFNWQLLWVIAGLGLIGLAEVAIDKLNIFSWRPGNVTMLEELVEFLGAITLWVGLLIIFYHTLSNRAWRLLQVGTLIVILVIFYGIAVLSLRSSVLRTTVDYLLDDTQADNTIYADDLLVLNSVSLPQQIMHPGDAFEGMLYFTLNRRSTESYSFSAHLLSYPNLESKAQQDDLNIGDSKTSSIVPDRLIKQPVQLTIPPIDEATAFELSIRIWSSVGDFLSDANWEQWNNETVGLPVSETTHQVIGEDSSILLLKPVVVIPTTDSKALDGQTIKFVNGITVTAPANTFNVAAGEPITMRFQWTATQPIEDEWVQLLHIRHKSSQEFFVFDAPPFEKRLPTTLWTSDFRATDQVTIPTDDLPEGEYEVLTGLYNPITGQRLEVEGEHENSAVTLTSIQLEITE